MMEDKCTIVIDSRATENKLEIIDNISDWVGRKTKINIENSLKSEINGLFESN